MKLSLSKLLVLGVALELLIFVVCYLLHPEIEETFRFAARYSGRLSAVVFLFAFYGYAIAFPKPLDENKKVRNLIKLFAVLHLIHFGFLATNIYLNDIELVPVKLLGGALAYLMIVLAPFALHKLGRPLQLLYFYYVAIVMTVTYIARVQGDFEGSEPYWLHYAMLGVFAVAMLAFGIRMWKSRKSNKN
ncbi:hypothetical protein FEE95_13040 [Maribacter algarum]|uniref:Uncharacterized protein n=1 Tax=Maribacter algarum (ex Zhang et al. 2020) TaxID=2578118 RepID=A0A5S3QIK7_9FLAO|nr:hypothetical protein [Maribacter algarum]TMM57405.1 hypothetical protein FEE95_13040 [Maribacter algarum]